MNKRQIKYIVTISLLLIVIIIDTIFIMNYNGLIGAFHINDEKNKEEVNENVLSEISINEKEAHQIIYLEKPVQLTLSDNLGNNLLNNWNYNWISSDSNIASISSTGLLIGKSIGTVSIRVTNKNNVNLYDLMVVTVINEASKLRFSSNGHNEDAMILGEIRKLSVVTGGDIALNALSWESSDDNIITVNNGYIEAKSLGRATISVYSVINPTYSDTITIEVKDNTSKLETPSKVILNEIFINGKSVPLESIENQVLKVGDSIIINACTDIQTNSQVIFMTNTSNVELVSNKQYVGQFSLCNTGKGQIKISSKYDENIFTTIDFIIVDDSKIIDNFNLTNAKEVSVNNYLVLEIKNNDSLIDFNDLIVSISDESIATYDSGVICPLSVGTTKVLVTYLYDKTKYCEFDLLVKEATPNVNISHISFNDVLKSGMEYELNKLDINYFELNDELTFKMSITPLNTTYLESIKIFSSNNNMVNINYQIIDYEYVVKIVFLEPGSIDIYIKSFDEKVKCQTIKCHVGVDINDFDFSIIRINNLIMGKTYTLKLDKIGTEPTNIIYSYASSNPKILSIGSTGEVMAVGEGSVQITVTATYDRIIIQKTLEVKVIKEYKEFEKASSMVCSTYIKNNDKLVPINFNESFLNVYQKAYLTVSVSPNNALTKNYEVISSDESIVYVSYVDYKYQLYALKPGVVTIKINNYENEQLNQEITIHVYDVLPKYYLPVLESDTLVVGSMSDITFNVDSLATYSKATYTFTNDNIVDIVNDTLIPIQAGETILIIKIQNEIDEYVLSIPLKVVMNKAKTLSSFNTYEIVLFFVLHLLIYLVMGIMVTYIFKKPKFLIIASSALVLLAVSLEILKHQSISISIIAISLNLIGLIGGIILSMFILIRGKKHA